MKLQVALDYLMVFTFVLLVFTILFSSIAKQRIEFSSEQSFAQLQVIAQTIASEISDAGMGGNGYFAAVQLPSELSIIEYNVTLTRYGSVIVSSNQYGQKVQAVAFGGQYNVESDPSYLVPPSNTFYLIPTYSGNGTITFQNSMGTICVDYSCPSSSNQIAQLTATAQVGQAVQLGGPQSQDSHINIGPISTEANTHPMSYSVWFDAISLPSAYPMIFGDQCTVSPRNGYDLFLGGSGSGEEYQLTAERFAAGADYYVKSNGNVIYPNTWHLGVLTYDGAYVRLYLDGVLQGTAASTGSITLPSSAAVQMSVGACGSGVFGNYRIANLQIYNTSLSSNDVQAIFNRGISGQPIKSQYLLRWYPFAGNLNDYSGNGYNGNPYGSISFPTLSRINATATNSTGNSIVGALIGFSSTSGNFSKGPSTSNFTNSEGNAYAFLNQNGPGGTAAVKVTAFNGNLSTTANLIEWYPLNLGKGANIYDISPTSANVMDNYLVGNIAGASWSTPDYVARFDGQSSFIQIPSSQQLQLSQLTINAWINATGANAGHFAWIVGRYGAYGIGLCGVSMFVCYYDYANNQEHDSGASLLPDTWYMISAVIDAGPTGGTESIYVNGVPVFSNTLSINNQQGAFQIGGVAYNSLSQDFNGSISNVQIYSSSLNNNQIMQLYSMGTGGNPLGTAMVGWWPLNGDAIDYSGNGNNGTIYGNVRMVPLAGIGGASTSSHLLYASFNGVSSYVESSNSTEFQNLPNTVTITGWVNYAAPSTNHIGWMAAKVNAYGVGTCGASLQVCYYDWGGSGEHDASATLNTNTWYMLSAVIDGQTRTETVYVNGVNVISGPLSVASTENSLTLGWGGGNTKQYMNGGISNVQVYGTSLTQRQLQQLYQEGMSSTPLLNAGIVSWFPLSGDTNDYSNQNDQGISSNIIYYSQNTNKPYWTPGLSGYGLYFNGQGSNVIIPNTGSFANGQLTVSAWVYSTSSVPRGEIIGEDGDFVLAINKLQPNFEVHIGGSWHNIWSGQNTIANSWYMLTGVYNGLSVNLYVNGVQTANALVSGSFSNLPSTTSIGSWEINPYSQYYFNGTIADVQVYDTALSPWQVSQLYNAGLPISHRLDIPLGGVS